MNGIKTGGGLCLIFTGGLPELRRPLCILPFIYNRATNKKRKRLNLMSRKRSGAFLNFKKFLSLLPLRSAPRPFQSEFFPFPHSRIPGKVSVFFQPFPEYRIYIYQNLGDSMPDCFRLRSNSSSARDHLNLELSNKFILSKEADAIF